MDKYEKVEEQYGADLLYEETILYLCLGTTILTACGLGIIALSKYQELSDPPHAVMSLAATTLNVALITTSTMIDVSGEVDSHNHQE